MIELIHQAIDVERVRMAVTDPNCGAEVVFVGTTRRWTRRSNIKTNANDSSAKALVPKNTYKVSIAESGVSEDEPQHARCDGETNSAIPDLVETSHLIYTAYEAMAHKQIARFVEKAKDTWPLHKVAVVHRLGRVEPTEPSIALAVSSPHRREAFEAAEWLMQAIKHEVPIWKQEHYVQSGPIWIHPTEGSCNCPSPSPKARADVPQTLDMD